MRIGPGRIPARMRARQQLTIVGKEKLVLSVDEVSRFLQDIYQEDVPPEHVRRIQEQVEGWVTGIVLLLQARYVLEIQSWDRVLIEVRVSPPSSLALPLAGERNVLVLLAVVTLAGASLAAATTR